ncbi:hypothetical protein OPQ81_000765 [Rhizoctonia solani]|nr:hypothetical protein OPQ81_000765 [Rhizoctonia solani]
MVTRFTQEQKSKMDVAYILAGRTKPNRMIRQGIADKFDCSLDRANEYFKYLSKKSRKAKVSLLVSLKIFEQNRILLLDLKLIT